MLELCKLQLQHNSDDDDDCNEIIMIIIIIIEYFNQKISKEGGTWQA